MKRRISVRSGALVIVTSDQLERTTRGEMEQARRWQGVECYCGKCGGTIPQFIDNHKCRKKLGD